MRTRILIVLVSVLALYAGAAALADEYVIEGEVINGFPWMTCDSLKDCADAIEKECATKGGGRSASLAAQTNTNFYPTQCEGRCGNGKAVTILCQLVTKPIAKPKGPDANY